MNSLSFLKSPPHIKPRLVILGCGWAGYSLARSLRKAPFDITLISPRNHFLFTPLLTTTTVGTLEFRNVIEPVHNLCHVNYIRANCQQILAKKNSLVCTSDEAKHKFNIDYDLLAIACGATSNTFNVPGVEENCFLLKQVSDAQKIRSHIASLFERFNLPGTDEITKKKLMTIVIVGAGPASIEFAAELHDFLVQDGTRCFPHYKKYLNIHLIETNDKVLGMLHADLQKYTMDILEKHDVNVLLGTSVKRTDKESITLSNGRVIPTNTIVWNTGNKMVDFTNSLSFMKQKGSRRILVDEFNRPFDSDNKTVENIFALGDCSVNKDTPLPPTAQVAYQQAMWLSKQLMRRDLEAPMTPFKYIHRGTLAYLGGRKALLEYNKSLVTGNTAWIIWNVVYLAKVFSNKNRVLIPVQWMMNFFFGRNIGRF